MARSGINVRTRVNDRFYSLDVIYDLTDKAFKDWVLSKTEYEFEDYTLSIAERYKVVEDMQENGIVLYVDQETLANEEWWNNSLDNA